MTLRKHRILSFLVALVMLFGMNINAYADIIEPLDINIEGELTEGEGQEEEIGLGEEEQEEAKDEEEQEEAKDEEEQEEAKNEEEQEEVKDEEELDIEEEQKEEEEVKDEEKLVDDDEIETNPDGLDSPLEVPAPYIYYPESSKIQILESPMRMMSFEPMFSIMNDNGDFNNIEPPAPGSLDIDKWATPVEGSSNLWRIDLTLTGKNIPTTSDIVLVIDRSGSMSGSKLTAAKDAATNFVNTLLGDPNNLSTRIAVVSFAGDVTVHNQSDPFKDYTGKGDLLTAISGLNASGGTHTQAGFRQANALLSSSTANYKNVVLLSDGEPTYSYAINDFNSKRNSTYFENYSGNDWQNKDSLALSDYNYSSTVGSGTNIRTSVSSTGGRDYYYNHGNSAVAEAGYAKSDGVIVYSVGLSAGTSGQSVLDRAASPGKSYTASDSDLNEIFQTIAGSIAFAATDAVITDPMGGMFGIEQINETNYEDKIHVNRGTVSWDNVTETITWSLATISEGNPATMWYIVEISEDAESGVVYPTNEHTYVTYTNALNEEAQKSFPIPEVGINAGTIRVHYYRVDEDGDPINSLGDPITMIQAIMQTTTFMEGTDLELNTPYEVTGPSTVNIGGEDYYYNPTNNIGDNSPKTVTLTPSNTSEDVYFPYTKQTNVTVTFDDNYVGAPATYTRTTGKETSLGVQMPSDPIRAKYIFDGWNTLADGEGTEFTSSTIINNDLTVYAQWSPNIGATLSISDYSEIYDSDAHSITINNLLGDDVVYYSLTNNGSDWTTTKPEFTNVTSSSVTVYVKVENANYQDRTGSGTVTITPRPITISSEDASKTYDGIALTNNAYSITVGDLASGETLDSVNITGTITNAGSTPNTIGGAVIKDGSIDTTSNYSITYDPGTLTISKVSIVLTANSASKTYDGTPLTNDGHTITTGAFVGSEGLDTVTVVGSQTYVGSSANTITGHTLKPGTLADNYNISYLPGTLTINKANIAITVTADSNSKVYDGSPLTDSGSSHTGTLASGDDLQVTVVGTITNVGTVANEITLVKIMNGTVDVTENYSITEVDGTLTITKKTANIVVNNDSKVFGTSDPIFTGTVSGLVNNGDLGTVTYVRDGSDEDVGFYNDVLRAAFTPNPNYTVNVTKGDFTITPATAGALDVVGYSGVYDGESHSVTINGLLPGDSIEYKTSESDPWSSVKPEFTDVSSNTVYVKVSNPNYTDRTGSNSVVITPRTIVLTANSDSKTYDGTPLTNDGHTITTGAFVIGEGLATVTLVGSQTYVGSSANTITGHTLQVGTKAMNYNISYLPGTLTVTAADLDITVTANSKTEEYNGSPLTDSGWTLTSGSLIDGDVLQVTVVGSITNVGTVDNEITLVKVMNGTEDVTANYNITEVDGTLEVTKKTVMITAASQSFTYDGTSKSNSNFTVTGLIGSDDIDAVVEGSIKYPSDSPVVNKVMSHSFVVGMAGNYNVSYTDGALTMNTAAIDITVTADDNSKVYDGTALTDNGWTQTSGSLIDGDVLQVTVTGSITNVGTVKNEITLVKVMNGTEDVTANYNITEVDGTLEVTKKAVMITAESQSFTYDGTSKSNSNFTVTGLVGSDSIDAVVSGSIKYPSESPVVNKVMSHSFVVGMAGNYNVSYTDGALTMNTAAIDITVTADDNSKVYDGTALTDNGWTQTSGSLIDGDVLQVTVTGSITNVGTVKNEITLIKVMNGAVDVTSNYNITEVDGELEVTKRPATIVVNNASKVFGTADPVFTGTVSNLINSADLGTVIYVRNGTDEDVGVYNDVLRASYTPNANYTVDVTYGNFQIIPAEGAPLVVTGYTGVYDGNSHSISINNLLNDDTVYYSLTNNGSDWTPVKPDFTNVSSTLVYVLVENDNYEDRTGSATVSINPRTIVLTANSASKTYDGTPLTDDGHTITTGSFVGSEGLESVSVSGSQTNVGSSANTITDHELKDNTLAINYNISYLPGTLTITAAQIAVSVTANSDSRVYTGSEQTLTGYGAPVGLLSGHVLSGISASGSGTNVGSYPVTFTGTSVIMDGPVDVTENYDVTLIPGSLAITPAQIEVSVTANSDSRVYTGSEQTVTGYGAPVGLLSGHVLSGISASGSGTNVGSYPVTFTGTPVIMDGPVDVTENYDVTLVPGSLAITPAQIEVSVTANSDSRVYTGSEQNLTGYQAPVGVLTGHELSGISASGSGTNVGSYPVTFTGTPVIMDGLVDVTENYDVTLVPGNLTITPASNDDFDVTGYTGVYDGLEHGVSVTGQMPGDLIEFSLDGETWSTTNPMFINVSTTTVYVRATNPNYTDRSDSALVTITPRPITITAASDSKVYDGTPLTNTNFSITSGALVEGHNLDATVTGSQTNVGSSPNIPSGASILDGEDNVTSNYDVTYENGQLVVSPATGPSLVIDSYSGIYDGAYHGIELDGIIDGDEVFFYLLGDEEDLEEIDWNEIQWTTVNPTFVNVGSHTILVKVENENYNDRTGSGTVDITPRPITVTAGSGSKVFDNQPLSNDSYTLTSGTIVEGEELLDVTVSGTITQVGSVPNIPSNAIIGMIEGPETTSNYDITYVNGTLTITQQFIPTIYTVNFVAGSGGSLEGTTTINTIAGTVWSLITVPTPVANEGYEFIGWTPEFPTNIYQNWTFTANFQELEIEIIEEPIPEAPPVEEEEEIVEIEEEPIPEAPPILPRTGQADPMFLYGIGALLTGLVLRRKRR